MYIYDTLAGSAKPLLVKGEAIPVTGAAALSPDRKWVAFALDQSFQGVAPKFKEKAYIVWKVSVDGAQAMRLSKEIQIQELSQTRYAYNPAWSKDGDRVFFSTGLMFKSPQGETRFTKPSIESWATDAENEASVYQTDPDCNLRDFVINRKHGGALVLYTDCRVGWENKIVFYENLGKTGVELLKEGEGGFSLGGYKTRLSWDEKDGGFFFYAKKGEQHALFYYAVDGNISLLRVSSGEVYGKCAMSLDGKSLILSVEGTDGREDLLGYSQGSEFKWLTDDGASLYPSF